MIKHAAIKKDHIVYVGYRHDRIFRTLAECGVDKIGAVQGFVNDKGEFLDRIDAANEALEEGQIKELKWPPRLYSEDLY